jgi:sulfate/thiosulfate transport system permease protein
MSRRIRLRTRGVLPGFGLSLGYAGSYLALLVLLPLSALVLRASGFGLREIVSLAREDRSVHALALSFGTAAVAGLVNAAFGLVVAWVLVRYEFPGKRLASALVDLPFALPTAVAGIALTSLYAEGGVFGAILARFGIKAAFTPLGITIALCFVGLPFTVRTVEPVLAELDDDLEEAAETLGATRFQTFVYVVFPSLLPAILTGFALAFARGLGEYGSVVFISGNMPMKTEILPLLVVTKLEQYDYGGATALACVMLLLSFLVLFAINLLQRWSQRIRA